MEVLRDINQIYDLIEDMFKLNNKMQNNFEEESITLRINNTSSEFNNNSRLNDNSELNNNSEINDKSEVNDNSENELNSNSEVNDNSSVSVNSKLNISSEINDSLRVNDNSEVKNSENIFIEKSSLNNSFLSLELLKENNFAFQIVKDEIIKEFAEHIKNVEIQKSDVEKLCKLMYQLNNFDAILSNLTKLFLMAEKYEFVFIIICKIFVSHIGNQNYHSKNVNNFIERYFDRFIETVKFAKIQPEIYIPFLFKIYKSDKSENFSAWKNPALEYLQKFWNKNENWFLEFIDKNPKDRYNIFSAILNFDSIKGVEYLIND